MLILTGIIYIAFAAIHYFLSLYYPPISHNIMHVMSIIHEIKKAYLVAQKNKEMLLNQLHLCSHLFLKVYYEI